MLPRMEWPGIEQIRDDIVNLLLSYALGLFTFASFLKIMANRVFSHAFEHPEISAGRKSRFRARLGLQILFEFLKLLWSIKK